MIAAVSLFDRLYNLHYQKKDKNYNSKLNMINMTSCICIQMQVQIQFFLWGEEHKTFLCSCEKKFSSMWYTLQGLNTNYMTLIYHGLTVYSNNAVYHG